MADKDKRKREAIERPPGPGIAGTLGRGLGKFVGALGEGELRRMETQRLQDEAMRQAASSVAGGVAGSFRRFGEGFSSGATGREFDPNRVEPVAPEPAGPPAPAGFTTEPAFPRGVPGMGPPTALDQKVSDSMRNPTISPPVPPRPPTTLNDSATTTFPTAPDNSVFEAQAANVPSLDTGDDPRRGRGSDIPGGFTQIIRGTDVTFQGPEAGGREFRALPGMSLEESQRMAAAESPGFQFLDKQDVERQRVNASNMQAEAQRTQSIYGNTVVGRNANGFPSLILPDGEGGYRQIEDFSPQLTQAASQTGRFEFGKVESPGGGLPDTYMLDTAAGTLRNLTKEAAAGLSLVQVEAKAKEDFGITNYADLSKDQLDELLDDLELPPEIEAAVRLAQRNIQAEPEPAGPPT